ncbi:hypothetical protein G9P44_002442 [Scheffersomyces stipitis]|nr:hypothetical protein G9P44_002442 [Scheffersomyces stipitis]
MNEEQSYKRMQIKVLYSFNSNPTVFLSRSKNQYSVKTAQIPMTTSAEDEMITLGAFDLKSCVQQIIKSSPENFRLHAEDYAVYYKDITEQPEEPFVANGVLSSLVNSSKSHLIPGRVCQNLSASFLFGDKSNVSPLTLEIRLKLHTIEGQPQSAPIPKAHQQAQQSRVMEQPQKRVIDSPMSYPKKKPTPQPYPMAPPSNANSSGGAVKATRTKSLPIFSNIPNQTMFNIMHADKMKSTSRYDSKSVQDRFKSAPFLSDKIIDKPVRKHRRYPEAPQRAMRTRSMVNHTPVMVSSPINEEPMSDSTDDTEYRENNDLPEDEEEDEADFDELSPYTPQQPPYGNSESSSNNVVATSNQSNTLSTSGKNNEQFQSLPDLEDLDSKRTHTIPHTKLPKNHGLVCVNSNCATVSSITWRYFETEFRSNYFAIHRAKEFDKKHYDGMFGPLCNACYLFLRNKGFMRPENVVKKYLQQQRYKRELKNREEYTEMFNSSGVASNSGQAKENDTSKDRSNSLSAIAIRKSSQYASSPIIPQSNKFPTPSHTPSAINQVIKSNNQKSHQPQADAGTNKHTPHYGDFNELMNQLNSFGGPLTDIDPLPQDQQGITPPMIATKSNTRVIDVYADGDNKENCPPSDSHSISIDGNIDNFESMIAKSFTNGSGKSSPAQNEWINTLFTEPTPRDQVTPLNSKTPLDQDKEDTNSMHPNMPQLKTFSTNAKLNNKNATVLNMPSSPLLTSHQNSDDMQGFFGSDITSKQGRYGDLDKELDDLVSENRHVFEQTTSSPKRATRADTTNSIMSWNNKSATRSHSISGYAIEQGSTPTTDFFSNDDVVESQVKGNTNTVDLPPVFNQDHN